MYNADAVSVCILYLSPNYEEVLQKVKVVLYIPEIERVHSIFQCIDHYVVKYGSQAPVCSQNDLVIIIGVLEFALFIYRNFKPPLGLFDSRGMPTET